MRHDIPIDHLRSRVGPQIEEMADAVASCVHCGFCLATCPTYLILGEEMDSPRGRIVLMKGVLEGTLPLEEALPHIDPCLGCVACETSCPSGVRYGELITPFRSWSEIERASWLRTRFRRLRLSVMSRPSLLRPLTRLGMLVRPFALFMPRALAAPLALLPKRLPARSDLAPLVSAQGERRARVALLSGCAQQVLQPSIHSATVELLSRNGVEVMVPEDQGCCGALALHGGDMEFARPLARRNLRAFGFLSGAGDGAMNGEAVDAVLTNAAGCGSGLHDYPLLFKGEPEEDAARRFADSVTDVTSFLAELGLVGDYLMAEPTRVAYQDACHLAHAQKERSAPRRLLSQVQNLELVEPAEWEVCCGSAGLYNLDQPQIARQLGRRKVENLLATGAARFVTGNIGCSMQLQSHLALEGADVEVLHTVELLLSAHVERANVAEAHGKNDAEVS